MPSPADFSDLFDPCRTMHDANNAYKECLDILREAHRLCMARIVATRDAAESPRRKILEPQEATEAALKRSYDARVKAWAAGQGIPFQRVSKKLRDMYEEAHPE